MIADERKDHDVQIAIAGSMAVHLVLLAVVVYLWTAEMTEKWLARQAAAARPKPEVAMIFPDQIMPILEPVPPPPPPKEESAQYIRTSQNARAEEKPLKADFISDRNTVAASQMAPDPDGKDGLPTARGIEQEMLELADRDQKDGKLAEDGAVPVMPVQAAPNPMAAMKTPPSILKPQPPSPPPQPPPSPPQIAKAGATPPEPNQLAPPSNSPQPHQPAPPLPTSVKKVQLAQTRTPSPMEMMMKELDESTAQADRLPFEVKRAETADQPPAKPSDPASSPAPESPPSPPEEEPMTPAAAAEPPPAAPPVPVPDPVMKTAGPQDAEAFSPFSRTSQRKGTISNLGEDAVNAEETPAGRYMRQVTGAVEKRWHVLRRRNADAVTPGNMKLRFAVTATGQVEPPAILSDRKEADARMIDFTLQAILEAEIPPIPEDLLPLLEGGLFQVEYDVIIY